jgi:hypothetical protein
MNFINFPESNQVMGAGGNENTKAIRVLVNEHPDYEAGTNFYATKFEFDPEEKYRIKQLFKEAFESLGIHHDETILNTLVDKLPSLWLQSMHGFMPTMLTVMPPSYFGYVKKQLNIPQDN